MQTTLAKKESAISQLQQEYDSYKVKTEIQVVCTICDNLSSQVRVHSVLKQKSTAPSATEVETSLR